MRREASQSMWSRRTFLTRAGLGGLAAASLTTYSPLFQAEAAGEQSKLVVAWNYNCGAIRTSLAVGSNAGWL